MKTLLLSQSDLEGGAPRATYRLHQGLQTIGVESHMLVQNKLSDQHSIIGAKGELGKKIVSFRETFDSWPVKFYRQREKTNFWLGWLPDRMIEKVTSLSPEVINLHWICRGYVQVETLAKFNKPLVWTFHDMWAFTGGCNYSLDCDRYISACGSCPQLNSYRDRDLSRWVWQRKARAWQNLNLAIVTPSRWLGKCAQASSLFKNVRVEVIANGIDTTRYQPIERRIARELLKLPQDKQLILFGAMDATGSSRKGFHLFQPALQELSQSGWGDQVELVVFGSSGSKDETDLGFRCHYLGKLADDISLALVYAAADVFVAPSIQDNLPNTVMEAIACGTPCVAFNIGGMPDMIEHEQNGYLAKPYEISDLAAGIAWVLENPDRYQKLSWRAREKTEQEFTLELQAHRYLSLFTEMVLDEQRLSS